jgi:NAD(P)-dependent dehydrogenase (short-subunit alcohol dehydrogenase family)
MTRRAVVAGGAGDVGRLVAAGLGSEGYEVHLLDRADDLQDVADEVGAVAHRCDATDYGSLVAATAGLDSVDVLVNAVGAWPRAPIDELDPAEWEQVLRVNLGAPMLTTKALLPGLRRARGAVVNVSSTTALRGAPGMVAYSSAKAGLIGLTRSLAAALGPDGVRVNLVFPGVLVTESNADLPAQPFERARAERALRRDGYASDIVGAVLFFASDAAGFVTGQSLVVDGGQLFA